LYYYLGIVVQMYLKDAEDDTPLPLAAPGLSGTVALCAIVTVLLGLLPGSLVEFAKSSLIGLP
jgi:NADH-quinone oxidoreductase subunit N